ncbi:lysozyme-like domain-containing protein [Piptocephalis cylindrospora]|uniref:Lysozyme-like domain-containing protein n=1 Tax=Piptocephalis cylindrospora TaxID=1907219 RepID=A0A4P9Y6T7_9FUNG|nr:lysozyme-like domain-containing protein [Piptocephalis cylindrospora]|eukprot:RKP13941.1 lysozyme-like domain-containing protein [Piptocephalis cylindrospora]
MRPILPFTCILPALLLVQVVYASTVLRPRGYSQNSGGSCSGDEFFCKDKVTLGRCVNGEVIPFQCAAGTKCEKAACVADTNYGNSIPALDTSDDTGYSPGDAGLGDGCDDNEEDGDDDEEDGYDEDGYDENDDDEDDNGDETYSAPDGTDKAIPSSTPDTYDDQNEGESDNGNGSGRGDLLCDASAFSKAIEDAGYSKPSMKQFKDFSLSAIRDSGITSLKELAMFLAQLLHESGGLQFKEEIACKDSGCPGSYGNTGNDPDKMYFGRGYIQLTGPENYKSCSKAIFGDDRLAKDPTLVAKDNSISWAVSAWYWKTRVHKSALTGKFGLTTMDINGGLECGQGPLAKPLERFKIYQAVYKAFGLPGKPDPSGCY